LGVGGWGLGVEGHEKPKTENLLLTGRGLLPQTRRPERGARCRPGINTRAEPNNPAEAGSNGTPEPAPNVAQAPPMERGIPLMWRGCLCAPRWPARP
jgi:hypothetical protein